MNPVTISVIVLVYNVEKFIERCAVSLFEQTMEHNIEYIFVNDCSPDSSITKLENIIQKYPNRKEQIRIINHSKNLGSGAARNTGLNMSKGEYIIYCDGDDWVDSDMYATLYSNIIKNSSDIICCDFYQEYSHKQVYNKQKVPSDSVSIIKNMLTSKLHGSVCNKLVKRSLYVDNNIFFPERINIWEDLYASIRLFFYAKKISYVSQAFYHYNQQNTGSLLSTHSLKKTEEKIAICNRIKEFFREKGCFYQYIDEIHQRELLAKMDFVTDKKIRNFMYWRELWPESQSQILYSNFSFYNKIVLLCVAHQFDKAASNCLAIKSFLKSI